ncbi:hypothetical protein CRENBAI_008411 [Crenichthys baileyi]|uniref:Uncharacterized protein n=1 Tax=Crenichthys baileyi TaxID=28760 RepID=A0AAV9S0Z9_9TELE
MAGQRALRTWMAGQRALRTKRAEQQTLRMRKVEQQALRTKRAGQRVLRRRRAEQRLLQVWTAGDDGAYGARMKTQVEWQWYGSGPGGACANGETSNTSPISSNNRGEAWISTSSPYIILIFSSCCCIHPSRLDTLSAWS